MRALVSLALALGTVVAIVTACSVDVDLAGKGCPCPSGLLCDTRTNTCVTSLASLDEAGAPPPAACNEAECKCAKNEDCRDPKRPYCGPGGTCVECLTAPSDTCTAGGACNDQNQCVVGCKGDPDCSAVPGQKCNTTTHRCVECTGDPDCAPLGASAKCSPGGKCAETCAGDGMPCGTGGTCCGGFCLQTASDELNCGQCGLACSKVNNTPSCAAGKCVFDKCAQGYAHCRPPGENTGCETNIRTVQNCGACGVLCTTTQVAFANNVACAGDKCTYQSCMQGHVDNDKNAANGCEKPCGDKGLDCCPSPQMECNPTAGACRGNNQCN